MVTKGTGRSPTEQVERGHEQHTHTHQRERKKNVEEEDEEDKINRAALNTRKCYCFQMISESMSIGVYAFTHYSLRTFFFPFRFYFVVCWYVCI